MLRALVTAVLLAALTAAAPAGAADYAGPLVDAHSHLPNATAIDAYVAAMKRHKIREGGPARRGRRAEGRRRLDRGRGARSIPTVVVPG